MRERERGVLKTEIEIIKTELRNQKNKLDDYYKNIKEADERLEDKLKQLESTKEKYDEDIALMKKDIHYAKGFIKAITIMCAVVVFLYNIADRFFLGK